MRGFIGISAKLIRYNKRLARITSLVSEEAKEYTRAFYNKRLARITSLVSEEAKEYTRAFYNNISKTVSTTDTSAGAKPAIFNHFCTAFINDIGFR